MKIPTIKTLKNTPKTVIQVNFADLIKAGLKDIKNPDLKNISMTFFSKIPDKTVKNKKYLMLFSDLPQKIDMIEDIGMQKSMMNELERMNSLSGAEFNKKYKKTIKILTDTADTINVLDSKYSRIHSKPAQTYNWLKSRDCWLFDVVKNEKGTSETYRKNYVMNKHKKMDYEAYCKRFDDELEKHTADTFLKSQKQEKLKEFIKVYGKSKPDLTKYVYDKYYLSKLEPETAKIYSDIQKTYGSYTVVSNVNTTVNDAQYLQEELKLWAKAGKGKEKFPILFDVNKTDYTLLKCHAKGVTNSNKKVIGLRELLAQDLYDSSTLRHELNHENDKTIPDTLKDYMKNKFDWIKIKLFKGKMYKKALKQTGANEKEQKYGMTSKHEYTSVLCSGNMQNVEKDFLQKEVVGKQGMQEWIPNLEENKILTRERIYNGIKDVTKNSSMTKEEINQSLKAYING